MLYNIIRVGDDVTASTYRKVTIGNSANVEKIRLTLCISVESIDYDGDGQEIRLRGRNRTETEHVKLGAYHTLEIAPSRSLTVRKHEPWDKISLEKLAEALDPAASADLGVVMITEGYAIVCLVRANCTIIKARVETSLPKKKGAAAMTGYEKSIATFYNRVYSAVAQHVDWDKVKCLVIAGPGFAKESLLSFINEESVKRQQEAGSKALMLNRSKIVVASASTAYKHSIKEVLSSPEVAPRIKDTKAVQEARAMEAFLTMLGSEPARAMYGPGHVNAAHELGAIDTLLISDSLFRTSDPRIRLKYEKLVDDVRTGGGTAFVLSSGHGSGVQLEQLSGLAAILRFPLPELEEMEFDGGY